MAVGKDTFVNLNVSPIDAGSQKCTQGTPPVMTRKSQQVKMINWYLSSGSKNYADICGFSLFYSWHTFTVFELNNMQILFSEQIILTKLVILEDIFYLFTNTFVSK